MVPFGGFVADEIYVEPGVSACDGDPCVVYQLVGDPRRLDCADPQCASSAEVARRVYCTCLCSGGATGTYCECPTGFVCEEVLAGAGYCVRDNHE